MFCKLQHGMK